MRTERALKNLIAEDEVMLPEHSKKRICFGISKKNVSEGKHRLAGKELR